MHVLLFDIDGTLVNTAGAGSAAIRLAIEQSFGIPQPRLDIDFAGRTDRALIDGALRCNGLPATPANHERLRARFVTIFPRVLTERTSAGLGGTVLPGITDLLSALASSPNHRLHVMTGNLRATAERKLTHFGLRAFFGEIFGGDHDASRDELARKTIDALRQLCKQSQSDRWEHVTVIGDTPHDVRCAKCINASAVAVCTGSFSRDRLAAEHPAAVVDDFSDVQAAINLFASLSRTSPNGFESGQRRSNPSD